MAIKVEPIGHKRILTVAKMTTCMPACEALIAAYEATKHKLFLELAMRIANNICRRNTQKTNGLIWEHYHRDWQIDFEYNRHDPANLYKPWGYQPGHQIEWTKLLLLLNRHQPELWLIQKAKELFDISLEKCWDRDNGGIFYGFAPDGSICDSNKYFWVHAEAIVTAALLAENHDARYWQEYDKIWQYSWQRFCNEKHAPWLRILDNEGKNLDPLIASPGAKADYHTLAACSTLLSILKREQPRPISFK